MRYDGNPYTYKTTCIWVRSGNCDCLVTWFCYQLISKSGNKVAAVSWPDPCNILGRHSGTLKTQDQHLSRDYGVFGNMFTTDTLIYGSHLMVIYGMSFVIFYDINWTDVGTVVWIELRSKHIRWEKFFWKGYSGSFIWGRWGEPTEVSWCTHAC